LPNAGALPPDPLAFSGWGLCPQNPISHPALQIIFSAPVHALRLFWNRPKDLFGLVIIAGVHQAFGV